VHGNDVVCRIAWCGVVLASISRPYFVQLGVHRIPVGAVPPLVVICVW
jgi:hypothetical protein